MQIRSCLSQPSGLPVGNLGKVSKRRRRGLWALVKLLTLCTILAGSSVGAPRESRREQTTKLVVQIQRADYEGDRPALKRLYNDLAPFVDDKELGAKARYWRGFALWRRAINGSNETVDPSELEQDLKQAVSEFEAAVAKDPDFVDARASAGSALGRLMFLYVKNPTIGGEFNDPARMSESVNRAISYMNEAEAAEPENPRVLWVLGPVRSYLSQQRGEGPNKAIDAAIESYQEGLKAARARKSAVRDPLIPSWGEPECLMSLAGANLYRTTPNLAAAEQYARSALVLVPYWHYVRDILVPRIETARVKDEIIAIERAALDRWGKGDPQGYLEIMAPDVTYFDPTREKRVDGLAAVKEYIIPFTGKIRIDSYEMINPQVQRDGNVAILTFNLIDIVKRPDREEKVTVRWNSTEVYRRIDGNWKIIHSHWSYTKPELK